MIIKILLISIILCIFIWFLTNRNTSRAKAGIKLVITLFAGTAITTILFPEITNTVADSLGVGRGADLLLYMLSAAFTYFVVNSYIKNLDDQKKFVVLARKIAILEANQSKTTKR